MVALFVIIFLVVALTVDLIIQARQKKYPLVATVPASSKQAGRESLQLPKGVFFHPGHSWARILNGDQIQVGIDDFIRKTVGAIERISLPAVGKHVKQGDPLLSIARGQHVIQIVAPMSGIVHRINEHAVNNPALINDNPYTDGWLCIIEPEQLATNLAFLSIAEDAVSWIRGEVARFREFVLGEIQKPELVGATMFDGGVPVAGSLDHLEDSSWKKFELSFLR